MEEQNQDLEQGPQIDQDYNPVPHEEIVENSKNWKLIIGAVVIVLFLVGIVFFWFLRESGNTKIIVEEKNVNQEDIIIREDENGNKDIKYNGGLDKLTLLPSDIPSEYGIFEETPTPTFKYTYEPRLELDQQTKGMGWGRNLRVGSYDRRLYMEYKLYPSEELARKAYNEILSDHEEFYSIDEIEANKGQLENFLDDNVYAYSLDEDPYYLFHMIDSNGVFTFNFYQWDNFTFDDIEKIMRIWQGKLNNYTPLPNLTASEKSEQEKEFLAVERNGIRRNQLKQLKDILSATFWDAETKTRKYPQYDGQVSRSENGEFGILSGSMIAIQDHPRSGGIPNPPEGETLEQETYFYKTYNNSFMMYVKLEAPETGWYYVSIDEDKNVEVNGILQSKP